MFIIDELTKNIYKKTQASIKLYFTYILNNFFAALHSNYIMWSSNIRNMVTY